MTTIPKDYIHFNSSPVFTDKTIPVGLKRAHKTGPGVYGKLIVLEGSLLYCIEGENPNRIKLSPEKHGIIEPEVPHHVEVSGLVRFHIVFFKKPEV